MKKELIMEIQEYHQERKPLDIKDVLEAVIYCGDLEANLYINGECVCSPLGCERTDDNITLRKYGVKFVLEGTRYIPKRISIEEMVAFLCSRNDWTLEEMDGTRVALWMPYNDERAWSESEKSIKNSLDSCSISEVLRIYDLDEIIELFETTVSNEENTHE